MPSSSPGSFNWLLRLAITETFTIIAVTWTCSIDGILSLINLHFGFTTRRSSSVRQDEKVEKKTGLQHHLEAKAKKRWVFQSHTHQTTACQQWRTTWAGCSSSPSASMTWRLLPPLRQHRRRRQRHCSWHSALGSCS